MHQICGKQAPLVKKILGKIVKLSKTCLKQRVNATVEKYSTVLTYYKYKQKYKRLNYDMRKVDSSED